MTGSKALGLDCRIDFSSRVVNQSLVLKITVQTFVIGEEKTGAADLGQGKHVWIGGPVTTLGSEVRSPFLDYLSIHNSEMS